MNVRISPTVLQGTVDIISSKSEGHRMLIAAALSQEPVTVKMEGVAQDVQVTADCLRALGAEVEESSPGVFHVGPMKTPSGNVVLPCKESGSTLRFLIPLAAALGREALFTGEGRLPERPVGVLLRELSKKGVRFNREEGLPLQSRGTLLPGEFTLPGDISSQFITGLLFALPLLSEKSSIRLSSPLESRDYIAMTLGTLRDFGIEVQEVKGGWVVPGNQRYRPKSRVLSVEGDWSSGAFWLGAGVTASKGITCRGLSADSLQGDRGMAKLMGAFGGKVFQRDGEVTVFPGNLHGISIDASGIPDLVPILSVVGAASQGTTKILRAGRLRLKESDRLYAMARGLKSLGVSLEEGPDFLVIRGGVLEDVKEPVYLDGYGDHRIVMALAVALLALRRKGVIQGAEAVEKSYPDFFEKLKELGGNLCLIPSEVK